MELTKNKKILIAVFSVIILVASIFIYIKFAKGKKANPESAGGIIDQYRQQLPDLKQKAQSNKEIDLQNYAIAQYAVGDVNGSVESYKKQIAVNDKNYIAHNNLANGLRDQKRYEDAIAEYRKAIELSPKSLTAYANLGALYQYNLQDIDKAIEVYSDGIKAGIEDSDIYVLNALAYENKKDFNNAIKYYNDALAKDENNAGAKAGLERLK